MVDHNYRKLAQLNRIQKHVENKEDIVENILDNNDIINYQVPANSLFRLHKPEWIGNTVLHIAQENNDYEIFNMLIKRGADFTIKNNNGESVLHQAIEQTFENTKLSFWDAKKRFHSPFIKSILTAHVDFRISTNPTNKYGISHFHIACVMNDVKATEFFLKNGISVNDAVSAKSPIFPGYTPLHFAVMYYCVGVVELLLKNGANENLTDTSGLSPLHFIIKRNMKLVSKRKKKDCVWLTNDLKEELALNERLINFILAKYDANQWNLTDSIGLSPIHVVSTLQSTSLVEKAVEQDVDLQLAINADSPFLPGYTAFHFAAHFNSCIIKILLKNAGTGGNLTVKDAKGVTPLDICLQRWGSYFIHDLVVSQSIWNSIKFSDNETRLTYFLDCAKKKSTFEVFLQQYSNKINLFIPFNSPIWPGYTLLHLSVAFIGKTDFQGSSKDENDDLPGQEDLSTIKICLQSGGDFTIQDSNGSTPLHLAFRMCKPIAVNELIKSHDNDNIVNPVDKDGLSHLHIACAAKQYGRDQESEEECEKLVENLLQNGISPNCSMTSGVRWKNQKAKKVFLNIGWTPLHVAVALHNLRRVIILLEHGVNIYAKDINGLTPIHLILSLSNRNKYISNVLLSSENLKDSIANCGLSHLHVACYVENASAIKKLLENGADIEKVISYERLKGCEHENDGVETDCSNDFINSSCCDYYDPSVVPLFFLCRFAGCRPLHVALKKIYNAEITRLLVQYGADVNSEKADGTFPFYCTLDRDIYWWESPIIKELESNKTLQNCIHDYTGITMLHVYCAILDVDGVVELLNSEANVKAKVHMGSPLWAGCTPLHLISHDHEVGYLRDSIFQRFDTIASLLIKKGADVLCANAQQNTPVHEAFKLFVRRYIFVVDDHKENIPFVALLLNNQKDFSVNPADVAGVTHFHIACFHGNVTAVEKFLKHDVDVNSPADYFSFTDWYDGFTPFHLAVVGQSKEVVDLLLKHGVDPNSTMYMGDTSLHLFVKFDLENEDLFKSLISAGADMSLKNLHGATPANLLFTAYNNNKTIEIFLKHGIRVNVFDDTTGQGYIPSVVSNMSIQNILQTAVFKAPIFNQTVNDDDEMGRSPIHNIVSTNEIQIATENYTKAIEEYVKAGFDIDRRDKKGRTALHIAVQFKNVEGIEALLENGTDINIKDNYYTTPFGYCLQFDQIIQGLELEVFEVLKIYIIKLQSFGLYVNQINQIYDDTTGDSFLAVEQELYTEEVRELSNEKIYDSPLLVLRDFLSETIVVGAYPTMPREFRDVIDTFFQTSSSILRANFPNLACLLQLQYRKMKIRITMIESAKSSLNCLSEVEIPDLCSDIIFKSLANEDLSNLIKSTDAECQPNKRIRLD